MTEKNIHPLKESSLLDYDESKVNLAILLIIDHFKKQGAEKRMLLKIHRKSSGITFMNYFAPMIKTVYANECAFSLSENDRFPVFHFKNGFTLTLQNGVIPKSYP